MIMTIVMVFIYTMELLMCALEANKTNTVKLLCALNRVKYEW